MSRRRQACAHFEASAWQPHVCRRCFVVKDLHQIDERRLSADDELGAEARTGDSEAGHRADSGRCENSDDTLRKSDGERENQPLPLNGDNHDPDKSTVVGESESYADTGPAEALERSPKVDTTTLHTSGQQNDDQVSERCNKLRLNDVQESDDRQPQHHNSQEEARSPQEASSHSPPQGEAYKGVAVNAKSHGSFQFAVRPPKMKSPISPIRMSAIASSDSEMSDAPSGSFVSYGSPLLKPPVTLRQRHSPPSPSPLSIQDDKKEPTGQKQGGEPQSESAETVDSLLQKLRDGPHTTRRHAKGDRVGSIKSELKYTPKQQYRIARRNTDKQLTDRRPSGDSSSSPAFKRHWSADDVLEATVNPHSPRPSGVHPQENKPSSEQAHQPRESPPQVFPRPGQPEHDGLPKGSSLQRSDRDLLDLYTPNSVENNLDEQSRMLHQTSLSFIPTMQTSKRDQIIMPSERVSTLDFVNTQLSFIAQAWSQAEATSTDESLQQVSLQDFRLVDGVAPGGWCDGSATSPLWQQTLGPAGLPNEATFPVTCTRHGLKHPNRVYSLRVGINRQRGQDDAEQAYARFKTDYRVLERLTPHPNVLQVLAHFRNSIAQAFGEDTSKEQPNVSHAIFVITNHLPLLNTRMYLRKCEELLSVEGYERCVALLLFQLMDGLQHLHKEGAIHCNLTQDNLLIVPTMHPGGGDRLVISNFGDSIYYAGPPAQFTLMPEQATTMVSQGKGWHRRCQPPELKMASSLPLDGFIDLQYCDIFRSGILLYEMLGLEAAAHRFVASVEEQLAAGVPQRKIDACPPRVPLESCFSQPLHQLGSHLIHANPKKRLDAGQAMCVVGSMLWGPTVGSNGLLGLEPGMTAKMWLKRRRLELLAELAGAYSMPNGLQAGGFALADELHCRFLANATTDVLEGCLSLLRDS